MRVFDEAEAALLRSAGAARTNLPRNNRTNEEACLVENRSGRFFDEASLFSGV